MELEKSFKKVPLRLSKVESFLRHKLTRNDPPLRYYELCVIQLKGSLSLQVAFLSEEFLLLASNPPKKFTARIRLADVREIILIPDPNSPVKGKDGSSFICEHFQIIYKPNVEVRRGQRGPVKYSIDEDNGGLPEQVLTLYGGSKLWGKSGGTPPPPLFLDQSISSDSFDLSDTSSSGGPSPPLTPSDEEWPIRSSSSSSAESDVTGANRGRNILRKIFQAQNSPSSSSSSSSSETHGSWPPDLLSIHLYLYQPNSAFLRHFHQLWNRQILRDALGFSEPPLESDGKGSVDLLRVLRALKENAGSCDWKRLLRPLHALHTHLPIMLSTTSWTGEPSLPSLLLQVLSTCCSGVATIKGKEVFEDRCRTFVLVVDALRMILETHSEVLEHVIALQIVNIILNCGGLPPADGEHLQIVTRPTIFLKINLDKCSTSTAKVISLLSLCQNASATLLHDLLTQSCGLGHLELQGLSNISMEVLIGGLVSQIAGLLRGGMLNGANSVLLFKQVTLLNILKNTLPGTRKALQEYSEEFQYLIPEESVQVRVPGSLPIKPKLLSAFTLLRKDILQGSLESPPFSLKFNYKK